MKLSPISFSLGLAITLMSGSALAADQGTGKVTFTGSIINAACSIAPESSDQTVDLGQISIKDLSDEDKKSTPRNFDIALENCVLEGIIPALRPNTVTVTFSGQGAEFNSDILGISGSASGAGIAIAEQTSSDSYLPLGTESTAQKLVAGDNTLHFSAYLIGGEAPKEGEFTAVSNFTLSYQ